MSDFFIEGIKAGAGSNRDGHGYMLKRKADESTFSFAKGMWTPNELADTVENLKVCKDDILCVHNRMSTHGKTNAWNCHPFVVLPISAEGWSGMLVTEGTTTNPILMHNGILSEFGYSKNFSDTFNFVRDFISAREVLKFSQSAVWLERKIGYNKLAILHPKFGLMRIGQFIIENGCYFSNRGFEHYSYKQVNYEKSKTDTSWGQGDWEDGRFSD